MYSIPAHLGPDVTMAPVAHITPYQPIPHCLGVFNSASFHSTQITLLLCLYHVFIIHLLIIMACIHPTLQGPMDAFSQPYSENPGWPVGVFVPSEPSPVYYKSLNAFTLMTLRSLTVVI